MKWPKALAFVALILSITSLFLPSYPLLTVAVIFLCIISVALLPE